MDTILSKQGSKLTCPVAIFIKEGKILLGYRHYTAEKWKNISVWTVPGGRCDEGETIEQTLRREVYEETGIKNFDIKNYIGEVPGAKEGDIVPIFIAETNDNPTLMEPEKFSEWAWFKITEIPENFINKKTREL